jgi:streptogramin lyase
MKASKPTLTIAAALCVLALNAAAAQAAIGPIGSFGNTGPGALTVPTSIAVDQNSGDVYVADAEGNRIVQYDASGTFILTFGREVNKTKVTEKQEGKTISEAEENLCAAASADECQAGTEGSGAGQLNHPAAVAVAQNTDDVYVGDPANARVEKFDSSGGYISQIESGVGSTPPFEVGGLGVDLKGNLYIVETNQFEVLKLDPSGAYSGITFRGNSGISFLFPSSVAIDQNGFVYLTQSFGYHVVKLSPSGSALSQLTVPTGGHAEQGVAVDLSTGDVFTIDEKATESEPEVIEYNSVGEQLAVIPTASTGQIAYDAADGRLYQVDRESNEVSIYGTFPTPVAEAPAISGESASGFGLTSATISAQVDPNLLDTTYEFQYGTEPSLARAVSVPVTPADIGSGFLPRPVEADLSGLQQSTTYYYRVLARNSFGASGTTTTGPTRAFTTLAPTPSVTTGDTSEVTFDSATLTGVVTPGSVGAASDTKWCFQYGTGASSEYNLGSAPLLPGDAGQGTAAIPVSVDLTGLQGGATYRYRLVAVNSLGLGLTSTACGSEGGHEADGSEGMFTTPISLPGPLASTGGASAVSENAAVISGTVDPQGFRTTYEFQVGIDTSYGAQVFGEAGEGSESRPVGVSLQYLQPGTTYHYRLVAISPGGTSYGADATFTTSVFVTAALSAPAATPLVATPVFAFPAAPGTAKVDAKKKLVKKAKKAKRQAEKPSKPKGQRAGRKARGAVRTGRVEIGRKG